MSDVSMPPRLETLIERWAQGEGYSVAMEPRGEAQM